MNIHGHHHTDTALEGNEALVIEELRTHLQTIICTETGIFGDYRSVALSHFLHIHEGTLCGSLLYFNHISLG